METDKTLDRYDKLKSTRSQYDSTLQEAGKYAWPNMQDMVKTETMPQGQVRTIDIYDSTAINGAYKMTSGIFSNLMPVGTRWFEFKASFDELMKDPNVALWMSEATDITLAEIWRSNFQREMFLTIRSMAVLGTGCISVEINSDKDLVFRSYHIADIFFDEDSKGKVDTVFRRIYYTARQARQEFPNAFLGKTVEENLKTGQNPDQKFEFVHAVYPRSDYNPQKKLSNEGKKYVSEYINVSDKVVVKEGGFSYLPYMIGRFDRIPNDIMGRSPVIDLLPEIKMLNAMKKTFIEGAEAAASGTLLLEDDSVLGQPTTGPNAVMYYRSGSAKPEYLQTAFNANLNAEIIRDQQQIVKDGLFLNLFQVLADRKNISSAREVDQLASDSFTVLSPFVGSIQCELADPLISIVLDLLIDNKKIAKLVTEGEEQLDYDIVYQGRLAMAMSAMQANAIEVTLAKWIPYNDIYPVVDNVDVDEAFRLDALSTGVPAKVMRKKEDVIAERSARANKQNAMEQAAIMESASKAIKNVSGAPESGSIAGKLQESMS